MLFRSGCDGGAFLAWAKAWRQRARDGYVNGVAKYMPSLASGARCIQNPEAFDVQYISNGDYWVASCLAQKNGTLSHFFEMDINVPFDQSCLGDARLNDYVKGNQCKMPGGNQRFLDEVMRPCQITPPNSPVMRNPPRATPIDPSFFARLLNDRPSLREIVDENTRRVKVGPNSSGGGSDCASNPFLCPAPKDKNSDEDGNGTDAK